MKRFLKGLGVTLAVLVAVVALLYAFGGPVPPTRQQRASFASLQARGVVGSAPSPRLVVPIPGCVCHSADSVQIVQHSAYRLRECSRCH